MRLLRYTLRRLLLIVPVLAAALFLTFALTRIVPGNPIDRVAGPYISNEQRAAMKHQAYLDRPFYTQFALYVRDLAHGKMGVSYTTAQDVSKDLRQRFPASFELVTYAMLLAVLMAVPLGIAAAIKKDSWIDHAARVVSVAGVSMPIFWLGLILLYVFFFKYGWFPGPVGRTGSASTEFADVTGILTLDTLLKGDFGLFWEVVKALVLPCVTLGFVAMAPIARFTRATMAEVLESDYIRTARSLGLPFRVVVLRLALKNALIPILTIIAAVYGYALGGEVLVEIIFNWPGLGLYSYNAILSSDFPAIQGFVLLVTFVYLVIYLLLDLATAALDPRVKF
ncbi:MAG TPA: ABC transporter permease [Gaiellaceae bacterium]